MFILYAVTIEICLFQCYCVTACLRERECSCEEFYMHILYLQFAPLKEFHLTLVVFQKYPQVSLRIKNVFVIRNI